jgi:hypothetical protein
MYTLHCLSASLLALLHVAAATSPEKRQESGVRYVTVTETSIHTYSTTISGRITSIPTIESSTAIAQGSAPGNAGKLFTVVPSAPLAPLHTTVFITVHTRPNPPESIPDNLSSSYAPSTASSTSSIPSATPNIGKRGLSYNDPSLTDDFTNPKITWSYNWASDPYWGNFPPNTYNKDLTYIPMLWDNQPELTSVWSSNVAKARKNYNADAVLAFNEPDLCCATCGSTCISPSNAASAYRQWIQPLQDKLDLGAPAVTNAVAPNMGIDWLSQFMSACSSCTIDYIPIHWYGSAFGADDFQDYIEQVWQKFKKPIWVTEFGTSDGDSNQTLAFLKQVLPWMDQQDYVHRYAYFMARAAGPPFLLNTNNGLTSIGDYYNEP